MDAVVIPRASQGFKLRKSLPHSHRLWGGRVLGNLRGRVEDSVTVAHNLTFRLILLTTTFQLRRSGAHRCQTHRLTGPSDNTSNE